MDEPGHQVHQGRLARAVRADKAGDSRRNRQVHSVYTQDLAVELGDVLENDSILSIRVGMARNGSRNDIRRSVFPVPCNLYPVP